MELLRQGQLMEGVPAVPWGWFYGGSVAEIAKGPRKVVIGGRQLVLFRAGSGRVGALEGRCVHMGADLSRGAVAGDCLTCPFHEWSFGVDGRCERIPASEAVPAFARQGAYPVAVVGGHVFVFNRGTAAYAFPFFSGRTGEDLYPSRPFEFVVDTDWHMVAANGFDVQHFRAAHDRTLVGEPVVESPSRYARSIRGTFEVTGGGWRDRLTRRFSGPRVTMTVTSWMGVMVLVSAEFRRTTSYGMVSVCPLGPGKTRVRTIVWVPRSAWRLGRALVDPVDAMIRRSFIRAFMKSDAERSEGIEYNPKSLIDADRELAGYFEWLAGTVKGETF